MSKKNWAFISMSSWAWGKSITLCTYRAQIEPTLFLVSTLMGTAQSPAVGDFEAEHLRGAKPAF